MPPPTPAPPRACAATPPWTSKSCAIPAFPRGDRGPARGPVAAMTRPARSIGRSRAGCRMTCEHVAITSLAGGDSCCPAGATAAQDPDCSATCGNGSVEANETCDLAIAAGQPGACPGEGGCSDGDPCTQDVLLSARTCAATCVFHPILAPAAGDRLLPARRNQRHRSRLPVGVREPAQGSRRDLRPGRPRGDARGLPHRLPGHRPLHHRRAGGNGLPGPVPAPAHHPPGRRRPLLPARGHPRSRFGLPGPLWQRHRRTGRGLRFGHRRWSARRLPHRLPCPGEQLHRAPHGGTVRGLLGALPG